ncbi:MAG: polysaccharide biosynthesis/export family protein [Pirellulales bacterium]|nr:polysaccharide biosynthesis/export family protein [Pirellulales bacterium]
MQCRIKLIAWMLVAGATFWGSGCAHLVSEGVPGPVVGTPRELQKAVLPAYTIEPPDVLMIDTVHLVPKAPYHLRALDSLAIQVKGTPAESPISGIYPVQPGGIVDVGHGYGSLKVAGKTVDEVEQDLERHLAEYLRNPEVSVSLAEMASQQQIAGEHLVGPDGTVTLGSYGSVSVIGMTVVEAKAAVEKHLTAWIEKPEISLDVFGYNSKVYYVVTQGAGMGDGVFRFPVTGNETVLDAISQINGLEQVSSKRIWIARAGPDCNGCDQVFPVDWDAITQRGNVQTNYQILPGDRVYVAEDRLIALDNSLSKILAPLERVIGFTLLGTGAVSRLSGPVLRGGGNRGNTF